MRDYLPFLIIGLTTGAVYALAALGLVLTYRTSGVFNFGHGAIAMFCAYLFYSLRQHVPTPVALLVVLLVIAPAIGVLLDMLFRSFAGAGPTAAIAASLGLLVGLQGLAVVIYGGATRHLASIFPTETFRAFDLNIGVDQTLIVAIALSAGLALVAFFRATHIGLQTRAVVDNRALTGLVGTNATAVTRLSWVLGCAYAAASGILFASLVGLDSILITLLVVEAFGAAVVGRLQSFPATVAAAFGLGVAQSLATKIVSEVGISSLAGLPSAIPFTMLFVVLIFSRGQGLREAPTIRMLSASRRRGARFRYPVRSVTFSLLVALMLPPFLDGSRLFTLTLTAAFLVVFASLSLLIGVSRQLSLCHAVFVVLGATTLGHLQSFGLPFLVALPLAGLLLMPLGAAMAFPAIRLSTLSLGLATFGFGVLAQSLLFPTGFVFGRHSELMVGRPGFLAGDTAFCYFTLAVVAASVGAVELIRVSRLGRTLVALADSPKAVGSLGINPLATRLVAFCVSTFFAAVGGGLIGSLFRSVGQESFTFFHSVLWLTVLVVAGAETFAGVAVAAVFLVTVPALITASAVIEWQPVVFGVMAIGLARVDNGLVGLLRRIDFNGLAEGSAWRGRSSRAFDRMARRSGHDEAFAGGAQR